VLFGYIESQPFTKAGFFIVCRLDQPYLNREFADTHHSDGHSILTVKIKKKSALI